MNKKPGIPTLFHQKKKQQKKKNNEKKKSGDIVSRSQKYFSHTHTQTHRKENNEKLVLICPPSLYLQPSSPKLWTFPAGCMGDGW